MTPRGAGWLTAAGVLLAVLVLHFPLTAIGLQPDALLMFRPWSLHEVQSALTGPWLTAPVDHDHRPLSTILFSLDFAIFGLNSRLLHLESLLIVAGICTLLGRWLWREAGWVAAVAGMALYLTHPILLDSSIAGPQNQFQLLPTLMVVTALNSWARRRDHMRLSRWWPMLAFPVIGFYFKEDAIMVLPAMLALQTIRARVRRDVPAPSRALLLSVTGLILLLGLIRWSVAPNIEAADGISQRLWREQFWIAAYGPARTAFAMFEHAQLLIGTTAFVLVLQCAGARHAWRDAGSRIGWTWICGLVLLTAVSLPLSVLGEIRATRLHLDLMAAATMLGAGAAALIEWARRGPRIRYALAVTALSVGIGAQYVVQRNTLTDRLRPCSEEQLIANGYAATWPEITPDLRRWLADTAGACAAGRFQSPEDALDAIRWSGPDRDVVMLHPRARGAAFAFSAPDRDLPLIVTVDGRRELKHLTPVETTLAIDVASTWRTWLRHGHRVDIRRADGRPLPELMRVQVQ